MIVSVLAAPMVGGAIAPAFGDSSAVANQADSSLQNVQESVDDANQTNLSTANATIRGNATNDSTGASVIGAGDVNGDGVSDVLVGAPNDDTVGNNTGAAYLFYGPIEDGEYNTSEADAVFTGESVGDNAGHALAAGDLNGDNYTDIVIGAPDHSVVDSAADDAQSNDSGGNDTYEGAAYVIYGNETLNETTSLADADAKLTGEAENDSAGYSLATVATGEDDTSELLVGAPNHDAAGNDSGAVYVAGNDSMGEDVSLADADVKMTGEGENALAGLDVASAEDVNGDGVDDVLVGAPGNNSTMGLVTTVETGATYVVNGSEMQTWSGNASLADAALKLEGENAGDHSGWSVSTAGDVNGDGYADMLVGAPYEDSAGDNAGAAYLVLGGENFTASDATDDTTDDGATDDNATGTQSLADAELKMTGEGEGDNAGWAVSSAGSGDITCDELADIVVGAPGNDSVAGNDSGAAYLVYGAENMTGPTSLADANEKLHGEAEGDMAGYAVADVNDTSGDDLEDVAVGAPGNDANGEDAGAVYIVNSECPPEEPAPTTEEPTTQEPTTTAAPTTEAPTTEQPITEEPVTTEEPTTKAPKTTAAPTTEEPTTEEPTTKAPKTTTTTAEPTTERPTTAEPTTTAERTTKAPKTTTTTPETTTTTTDTTTTTPETTTTTTTPETTTTTTDTTTTTPETTTTTTDTTTDTTTTTTDTTTDTTTTTTDTTTTTTDTTTTTTDTTTTTTTTTSQPELPPPKFAGCSQIIVYSDSSITEFTVVLYNETSDEYSTVTVNISDADDTYDSSHPNFGVEGYTGYGFEQGQYFESGLKVVGLTAPADYINPNFDVEEGNCGGGSGGTSDGEGFDWSSYENNVTDRSGLQTTPQSSTLTFGSLASLLTLVAGAGLVLRRREF